MSLFTQPLTMFLSKLTLNFRCRDARRDMNAPYELHRTLARAFTTEDGSDYRSQHSVLFRIEPLSHASVQPAVLVQSGTEPNWHELPETYLIKKPDLKVFAPDLTDGQTFGFRLLANPTKKEKRPDQRQGRRIALPDFTNGDGLTPARAWLARKGEQCGFRVLYTSSEDFWLGTDRRNLGKNAIPIYGVRFDGLLQVTNANALGNVLKIGLGPSKAFGFGLLSLVRPH